MKKVILYICLFYLISCFLNSKNLKLGNEANYWFFGKNAGLKFDRLKLKPDVIKSDLVSEEGCAAISDSSGNLLFYSSPDTIWNKNNNIMKNGINIGIGMGTSSAQGVMIIRKPGLNNLYYVFTTETFGGKLCYSIVDMDGDNQSGEVITKNIVVDTSVAEKITAVMHSNMKDIWVIVREKRSANYYSYLLTDSILNTIPVKSFLDFDYDKNIKESEMGYLKASPDATKLASATFSANQFEIYDFNPANGYVSNPLILKIDSVINSYGVCFSPDGTKLYCTGYGYKSILIQYDISTGNADSIRNSAITLLEKKNTDLFALGAVQAGNDGKLYVSNYGSDSLSLIEFPNNSGFSSNFILNAIYLDGSKTKLGLPNIPYLNFNYNHKDTLKPDTILHETKIIIPDFSVDVGEVSFIPVINEMKIDSTVSGKKSCSFTVDFPVECFFPNASQPFLVSNTIENGRRILTFEINNILINSEKLFLLKIPGQFLMSSYKSFEVKIYDSKWSDSS